MALLETHFSIEPYCVLCQDLLVPPGGGRAWKIAVVAPEDRWRYDALCFYLFPSPEGSEREPRTCASRVTISNDRWPEVHQMMHHLRSVLNVRLCTRPRGCIDCVRQAENSVFLAHADCFQLARQRFGADAPRLLNLLACKAFPILGRGVTFPPCESFHAPGSLVLSADHPALHADTELSRLLSLMNRRLPVELQTLVYGQLPDLFRCLVTCSRTLDWASSLPTAGILWNPQASNPIQTSAPHAAIEQIGADVTDIFGETCLCRIGAGGSGDYDVSIRTSPEKVAGVQVSFGTYGVVALRVLYSDQSMSPWLGTPRQWFASCRCDSLNHIETVSDGFKIVRVNAGTPELLDTRNRFFWNHSEASNFLRGQIRAVADQGLPAKFPIFTNNDHRLAYYLPFERTGNGGMKSLTMFVRVSGVLSIMVDGDATRYIGTPPGQGRPLAVTHFFREGEFITSVRVLTRNTDDMWDKEPSLLLTTSRGRVLYYGGHELLTEAHDMMLSVFEIPGHVKVVGLFSEPWWFMPLSTFGVVAEPQPTTKSDDTQLTHLDDIPIPNHGNDISPFMVQWMSDVFLSKARLLDVKTLTLQRNGERCIGLLIEYNDGSLGTLGQWNPMNHSTSVIFDSQQGKPLESLYFIYSAQRICYRCVTDISLSAPEADTPHFEWSKLNEELAWWFNYRYDDMRAWRGDNTMLHNQLSNSSAMVN